MRRSAYSTSLDDGDYFENRRRFLGAQTHTEHEHTHTQGLEIYV